MPFEMQESALDSGVTVLAVSGTMTMGNQLQRLEWAVQDLAKKNQNRIVLDMSGVTYVDSSAVGVIVSCNSTVRSSGGQFRLAGVTARVATILKMTGLDGVLSMDPTRDDAVSALAAQA